MDFSKSPQETILEIDTTALGNSRTTDVSLSALNKSAANVMMISAEPHIITAPVLSIEDTVSTVETNIVKSYPAESADEQTVPIPSPRSVAFESEPAASSQLKSALQNFQALRAQMLSQLETANGMNGDNAVSYTHLTLPTNREV